MAKSRPQLINAIRRHPELINQPNTLGQTALHLSVHWLEGLQYLLEAGAEIDAIDQYGLTAIFYAATLSLREPLNVLAGKDCVLYKSGHQLSGALQQISLLERVIDLWEYARNDKLEAIFDTIIKLVVERRRKLTQLARISLDVQAVGELRLSNEAVLDRHASTAISMLSEKIDVPAWLKYLTREHSTVYHIGSLTWRQVQRLWDAGFREIDELDEWGRSPLMVQYLNLDIGDFIDYWELAAWLVAKGADLHHRQERVFRKRYEDGDEGKYLSNKESSTTALHYLAANSGRYLWPPFGRKMESFRRFVYGLVAVSEQGRRLVLHMLSLSPYLIVVIALVPLWAAELIQ